MKARPLSLFLLYLILLLQPCIARYAAAETYPNRLSFAISGGASMGAYEAGLIWGLIEIIRQIEDTGTSKMVGVPRPIKFASIAGTSAGGINTLLAALAWSVNAESEGGFTNRIDDNIFRDVWLTPDVNRLLPTEADSSLYLPDDALLSRKDLVAAARELREKWRRPGTFRPGLRLPMGVTVTRVLPDTMLVSGVEVDNQRFYIPFELHTQPDGSAKFFFNPNDYASLADPAMILMPWPTDGAPFFVSDQQVEDALLATSAFPTGFGRKRLLYCRIKVHLPDGDNLAAASTKSAGPDEPELACPDGYQLMEAEFADGGLFDNLPIGLARLLSESSRLHVEKSLPVKYIYLDPVRERYSPLEKTDKHACDNDKPPEACRSLTFNFASETVVLKGAIGTARRYELFRELTGDNWRLNLSQLSREVADIMDANQPGVKCESLMPIFDRQMHCSDRLRYTGRLLEQSYSYRFVPIFPPFSAQHLLQAGIADNCRSISTDNKHGVTSECTIDVQWLRKQLANVLEDLSAKENLLEDIRKSALSGDSDRSIQVTSRGGPITGLLLDSFGAFLDYKFREFDYFVGIYDAIEVMANNQCANIFPLQNQQAQRNSCHDQLSEQLYHLIGVADNPKSRYLFALMAEREFGDESGLHYAYDPMPPEDRDIRIIYEGLNRSLMDTRADNKRSEGILSNERKFFEYLEAERFEPTPPPEGGKSLLAVIMEDPDYWSQELVERATSRLVHLEEAAEEIYKDREPDPEKQERANTALMGAGALALRTATYKYPKFTFSPSTAPDSWFWRNIIPYEAAFDLEEGDIQLFWQPTWNFKTTNVGLRMGLGFTGGVLKSSENQNRKNYGTLGLDLTRMVNLSVLSGWGITPAVFHSWKEPSFGEQTSFGFDLHVYLFRNRMRISLGSRDVIDNINDTLFLNVGFTDLPGITYWLSR